MFNVAIINKKEILKLIINIIIFAVIIFICSKILKIPNKTSLISKQINLIQCFEKTLPQTKINKNKVELVKSNYMSSIFETELNTYEIIKKEQNVIPEDENINNNTEQDELTQNSEKNNIENVENSQVQTGVQVQDVTRNAIATKSTDSYNGVEIKNETSYELTDDILNPDININNKNIIIFHTHTCESYTSSEKYPYEPTGNYRTTDQNFSVVRVGDELEKYLTQYGFNVIHDKTYHDYPAYTGSYTRSQKTVENILNNNSSDIIIDLHRDAIGSNNNYAPAVKIGDETAARIMFVMGSNGGGLWHPNWQQNLKFAIKIQQKSNELYPGFAKPIMFRNSRYNQQLAKAACIIEVGSTGNTLEECLNSMKYLAFIMKEALK